MNSLTALDVFLEKNNFREIDVESLSKRLYEDMVLGLETQNKSHQLMSVMPFPVNLSKRKNKTIVIDAGGTNFRSCLVEFSEDGEIIISEERKSSMIALDREYSKEEFFLALEDKISYLKNKAEEIHFCFSYAMKNTEDGDAQVVVFSKQVRAKAVVNSFIGKELETVLKQKGWTTVKKIKVINDTIACLLSGLSLSSDNFDTYIGLILGTGINNSYIEKDKIGKTNDELKEHIVVCECGMYKDFIASSFDKLLDKQSINPGESLLEKMCSGVYIGKLVHILLKEACKEKLFSYSFSKNFEMISDISAYQIDLFLNDFYTSENVLENVCVLSEESDKKMMIEILNLVIKRSAQITAAVICATSLKACGDSGKSVCVTCNGSTFWKTTNLKSIVEKELKMLLTEKYGISFELKKVENDITIGTALA